MRKFLAIAKREYLQRVRTKMFIAITLLGPLVMSLFGVAPALIFSIKVGDPVSIAVIDQTGKLYPGISRAVSSTLDDEGESAQWMIDTTTPTANKGDRLEQVAKLQEENFKLEEVKLQGRSVEEVKNELNRRISAQELDGYLILPPNLLQDGSPQFFGRNSSDLITKKQLAAVINEAVREQRLAAANIDVQIVHDLSKPVTLQAIKVSNGGEERDSGEGSFLVFGTGFIIYLTILMYGQVVLGAVIEEKETRTAEILFSSVRPFLLMMGKLIGVSIMALTQLGVWGVAFLGFAVYGVGLLESQGLPVHLPRIPVIVIVYFALFFLLGYFIYSTLYALVGSMVTTAQEGGQLSMPIILLLVIGFYLAFPVIRSPDSSFAFWVSMFPFFSPITMLVRIVTQTPPFWQILLSLAIGFCTVIFLTWLAARIYRVGMLMYGKKATIPEVWRWLWQS